MKTNAISASRRTKNRLRSGCTATVKHVVTLLCTVRDCHQPLAREEKRLVCERNHAYDVARSGYVNLLQPQDRRSANPGDSKEAVAARRRLADRGLLKQIKSAIEVFVR